MVDRNSLGLISALVSMLGRGFQKVKTLQENSASCDIPLSLLPKMVALNNNTKHQKMQRFGRDSHDSIGDTIN